MADILPQNSIKNNGNLLVTLGLVAVFAGWQVNPATTTDLTNEITNKLTTPGQVDGINDAYISWDLGSSLRVSIYTYIFSLDYGHIPAEIQVSDDGITWYSATGVENQVNTLNGVAKTKFIQLHLPAFNPLTDSPGTHYYALEVSNTPGKKATIYKWSMYVKTDSGTAILSNSNVTASKSLNTLYNNYNSESMEVFVTARVQISLGGGIGYFWGNASGNYASGKVGIESGLMSEDNTLQLVFIVPPNSNYTVDSSQTNAVVTLEDWREVLI
ncbi:MAG: hypothetical protein PHZ02_01590 [Desulfocapsaceae bacterium]|nr:hypothetical protein [Desulfocapsaceae bacterium]